jgi:hypothetical protein
MRVRVALALATQPSSGGAVDTVAVTALLADIDALLSDVNVIAQSAPPELQPGLEEVRNALVKEAINFSEAAQRAGTAEVAPAAPAAPRARAATHARVLSVSTEEKPARQSWALIVMVAVVLLAVLAYHGNEWLNRKAPPALPSLPGAPAGMTASPPAKNGTRLLLPAGGGGPPSAAEVERFKQQEQARGNEVRELQGGGLLVVPRQSPEQSGK